MGTALKLLLSLGFCLVVVACTTLETDSIRHNYTETVRKNGIIPVYPPREEFQVGDVFLASIGKDPRTGEFDPDDSVRIWIADFPYIAEEAERYMDSRIVFGSAKDTELPQGSLKRRGDLSIEGLPITAFPSITADAGLTTGVGIVQALQSLGLGTSNRTQVRLNFADVRTYWVEPVLIDPDELYRRVRILVEGQSSGINRLTYNLDREIAQARATGRKLSNNRCTTVLVVTRVYLTRNIQYTYFDAAIIAAGARRAEAGGTPDKAPQVPSVAITVNQANKQAPLQDGETDVFSATDTEVATLKKQISDLEKNSEAGFGVNFEAWNNLGIHFLQTYSRPVAIGYEGFSIPYPIVDVANQRGYPAC